MNYRDFIRQAKEFANRGENYRVKLMLLLVEYEPQKALWLQNPHGLKTWDMLLRTEGLCTPTLYHAFKQATKLVDVEVFGVYASVSIARLPKDQRSTVIKRTKEWIGAHKVPPHYQRVVEYVRQLRKDLGIRAPEGSSVKLRRRVARLEAAIETKNDYIGRLVEALRRNGIRPPKE